MDSSVLFSFSYFRVLFCFFPRHRVHVLIHWCLYLPCFWMFSIADIVYMFYFCSIKLDKPKHLKGRKNVLIFPSEWVQFNMSLPLASKKTTMYLVLEGSNHIWNVNCGCEHTCRTGVNTRSEQRHTVSTSHRSASKKKKKKKRLNW